MFRFIKGLLCSDRPATRRTPQPIRRPSLGVESLDQRALPSITMVGSTINVVGDNGNDIVTVSHNTLYDEIVVTRKYGNNKTETKSYLADPIDIGVGPVQKKPTMIKVDLKNGTNKFVNSTSLPSDVTGGTGKDEMHGGSGQDTFKGMGGSDYLYGNGGPDRLYGGTGDDLIDGGAGRDWLYGNGGLDLLLGGPGVDGLYGGAGIDVLDGNGASDRFLLPENNEDIILGYDEVNDVKIFFEHTTSSVSSNGSKYAAKVWSETDIEKVDRGLAAIHEKTGNNLLLKHDAWAFDDDYLHFRRAGGRISGKSLGGWNDGLGTITLTDNAFTNNTAAVLITVHEIGHEWDDEYAFDHGWLGLSGWTDDNPNSSSYVKSANTYGDDWWYLKSTKFVSTYAKNDPVDDFADSFAAYFLRDVGMDFTNTTWFGASSAPTKMTWLTEFVANHTTPAWMTNW